jgi:hypothetical protein
MWKPSDHPRIAQPDKHTDFETVCNHYNEYYEQNLKQFRLLATMLEHICVKYGIEEVLKSGATTSREGSMIIVNTYRPRYKLSFIDPGFDMREHVAHKEDYHSDISITIHGYGNDYKSCIGLKLMTSHGIMLQEIPSFDSSLYDSQELPTWFTDGIKAWL